MALIKNKISVLTKKADPNRQNPIRVNGWTYPFHWLQIIAWIFYLLMSLICFTFIVPTLPNTTIRCVVLGIKVFLFIVHFITHVFAVTINPVDNNVAEKLDASRDRPKFDRSKHSHVIENQFCYICETTVGSKSKHCSLCNKCVSEFDHHCKWLNNCVGGKNYRWFIYCVVSALLGSVVIFINCLVLTIAYFSADSWLYHQNSTLLFFNNQSNVNKILQIVWIVVIISSLILSVIAVVLLTHLVGFHLFLKCMGLSTYEFVVNHRKDKPKKSLMSGMLNDSERNKLVNYLTRLQKLMAIVVCTKKRVKPSDIADINSPNHMKRSKDQQFIESVVKDVTNGENGETFEISDVMKSIENSNNEMKAKNETMFSPQKSGQQIERQLNELNKNNEKFVKKINPEIDTTTASPKAKTSPEAGVVSDGSDGVAKSEPIFKPLNESLDDSGRTSRLSFVNKSDFIVPSVWSESGFASIPSNQLYIRYNSYKLNDNNVRLNRLHRKRQQINHEMNANNDNTNTITTNA